MKKLIMISTLLLSVGCASTSKVAELETKLNQTSVKGDCTALSLALIMGSGRLQQMMNQGAVNPEEFFAEQQRLQQLQQLTQDTCRQAYPEQK